MASALLAGALGTTPPQYTPSRSTPRRQISGNVVAFRGSSTSEDVAVSIGKTPNSMADINSWRSMSRSSRDTVDSNRLLHTRSIPKSASFVKVEGFQTATAAPVESPPMSPSTNSLGKAPSLLTRQLSVDAGAHPMAGSFPSSSLGSDTNQVLQRLEEKVAIKLEPVPRPASLPRRPAIPDDLLEQMQVSCRKDM